MKTVLFLRKAVKKVKKTLKKLRNGRDRSSRDHQPRNDESLPNKFHQMRKMNEYYVKFWWSRIRRLVFNTILPI